MEQQHFYLLFWVPITAQYSLAVPNLAHPLSAFPWEHHPSIEAFKDSFHVVTGGLRKPGAFPLPPESLKNGNNKLRKRVSPGYQHSAHAGHLGMT